MFGKQINIYISFTNDFIVATGHHDLFNIDLRYYTVLNTMCNYNYWCPPWFKN